MPAASIHYEGLREVALALKEVDEHLLGELKGDLEKVGNVVCDEAQILWFQRLRKFDRGPRSAQSITRTGLGFQTRVRLGRGGSLVSLEQTQRKTTGRRPDYGALQVRDAMLPARARKLGEAERILEDGAVRLLP